MFDLLAKNEAVFPQKYEIGKTKVLQHQIHTGEAQPVPQRPRRTKPITRRGGGFGGFKRTPPQRVKVCAYESTVRVPAAPRGDSVRYTAYCKRTWVI